MKDFNAISKTYGNKFLSKIGLNKKTGDKFIRGGYESDHEWYYERMFYSKILTINSIHDFLKTKTFKNILEIGCSGGLLPFSFKDILEKSKYMGVDLSQKSIEIAEKKFPQGKFVQGDFFEMNFDTFHPDLIISIDVIDHVHNPDLFLEKIIKTTKNSGYIRSYRGYYPDLESHKSKYREDEGIFYNDLSIKQIEKILLENNIHNYNLKRGISRNNCFYDSDIRRKWDRSTINEKKRMMEYTGFSKDEFEKLPKFFETSVEFVKKSQNPINSKFLDLPRSYDSNTKSSDLTIIFSKE